MATRNIFFGTTSQGKISYNTTNGNFILGNSNTDLLHINNNTNVGVGFSVSETPNYRLDVSGGDVNTDGNFRINGNIVLSDGALGTGITSIGPLDSLNITNDLTVDGTTLYVDSSGNQVGIGTTAPTALLDVNGDAVIQGDLTVNGTLVTFNTDNVVVEDPLIKQAKNNTGDTLDIGHYGLYNDGVSKYAGLFRDATDGSFKFFTGTTVEPTTTVDTNTENGYTEATVQVGTLNASTLVVDTDTLIVNPSTDRVGINKAVPTEALDVVGNIGVSGNILATLDDTFDIGTTGTRFRDLYLSGNTIHLGGAQLSADNTTLKVAQDLAVNENNLYVDTTNGRVGIGTTTPTEALEVVGDVNIVGNLFQNGTTFESGWATEGNDLYNVNSGNVGIGTTQPLDPLHVVGDIRTTTAYNVGSNEVLSATTLGGDVVNSSLQNLGTQDANLNMGSNDITNATSITATNLTGTLQTAAQGNITSVGTLTGITVSGNIEISGSYNIDGASVLSETNLGTGIINSSLQNLGTQNTTLNMGSNAISNVTTLTATTLNGTIGTAAQPNITSVGTLTSATITGDLTVDSDTLYIDSTGNNVGIGTTNPTGKLHIVNDTDNQNDETGDHGIKISTGTSGQTLMMGYDSVDNISYINSANTDGTTHLTLQTRGSGVGIGTVAPAATLHVENGTDLGQVLVGSGSSAISRRSNIQFRSTFGTGVDTTQRRSADIVNGFTSGDTWGGEYLAFHVGNNGSINDAAVLTDEKMRILTDGKVGIGITNPSSILNIEDTNCSIEFGDDASINANIKQSIKSDTNSPIIGIQYNGNSIWGMQASSVSNQLIFGALSGSDLTPRLVVTPNHVGIGTTLTDTRLHVNASIIDDNNYTYDADALMVVHQTATGTATLNDPKEVLYLGRQGASGQAYGAASSFSLSRYENAGGGNVGSRTRLDLNMAHDTFDLGTNTSVMSWLSGGSVGIGTGSPGANLDILATGTDVALDLRSTNDGSTNRVKIRRGNRDDWLELSGPGGTPFGSAIQLTDDGGSTYESSIFLQNDTKFIQFKSLGSNEGYLTRSSSDIQMNFTGQHRSFSNNQDIYDNINNYIGLIVSASGQHKNLNNQNIHVNDALPIVDITNIDNDKKVFGVISDKEEEERSFVVGCFGTNYDKIEGDDRLYINSLGEGMMWICDINGDLENGDYITSSTVPGYGKLQNDDLLHNYTVGKTTQDTNFSDMSLGVTYCRYVDWQGNMIDENTYNTMLGVNSSSAYKAKFCAVSYHCG